MKSGLIERVKQALEDTEGNRREAAEILDVSERTLYRYIRLMSAMDDELIKECVKANKDKQKAQDINRIERKSFREQARVENAVSEYTKEIAALLRANKFTDEAPRKTSRTDDNSQSVGVVHWTDQHLNERVSLPHNIYDWNIAAKRLKKHVTRIKRIAKAEGITRLLVAFTGDLINSDRRIDELLANAGNRAKASVLAVNLYQQALRDLSEDFIIDVASICGNESRFGKDIGWEPEVASDSFDFTINEHLKLLFEDSGRINFVESENPTECIVGCAGQNVLLIHGHSSQIASNKQKSVQQIIGRYAARGVKIDMIIWGHLHECAISDHYARGSSLVGSNDYSESALGLAGRSSQNFYIVHDTGGFDGIKIDLQNTDGIQGYDINKLLECYNTKSANKCKPLEVIHQIVT